MEKREEWGSRIGMILAMAGNAVGLGNFLRFPVQAAENGGGAFMIPYFVSFFILAIPLMWVEWTIGRYGGHYKHGSMPGMFDALIRHPAAKYFGVIGLFTSTTIMIYYTYIESWTLGFSFFALIDGFPDLAGVETIRQFPIMENFLKSYQGAYDGTAEPIFKSFWTSYGFLIVTMGLNFYVLYKGISGGIEKFAKIAMPLLLAFGIFLAVYTLTLGTPDPINHPERSVWSGMAFIWNPNFEALSSARIWLAAAGQVFFTLSVGMGTLHAYASYLRRKNDIALSGLATASINEFSEVILGGTIAIPIAVAFFGVVQTQIVAEGGAYDLGFVSMPIIFQQLPAGRLIGFLWFFLLFFAGITSSVAMAQPLISFLKEQFKLTHGRATFVIGILIFAGVHLVVLFYDKGFLDEMDYWAGTFALVILALIEVIVLAWIFGIDNAWRELNYGSDIKIPIFFKYIIKYVTPAYIIFILIAWSVQDAIPTFLMKEVDNPGDVPYLWAARGFMVLIFGVLTWMVFAAWKKNKFDYD